jgi:hypothetical protein
MTENGQRKTENDGRDTVSARFSAFPASVVRDKICPACGGASRRDNAKFCLDCGKSLFEDYQPLDHVRASYRLQGKTFEFRKAEEEETANLFERNKNTAAQTAWACLVYSMVPYLGILFIPFTVLIGGVGYAAAVRRPDLGGRRMALASLGLSFVVLLIQLFLWWLLYIVPELGREL